MKKETFPKLWPESVHDILGTLSFFKLSMQNYPLEESGKDMGEVLTGAEKLTTGDSQGSCLGSLAIDSIS